LGQANFMHMVIGLGNPGSEFTGTRHNIGWEVVDRLAARLGWIRDAADFDRQARKKFSGLTMEGPAANGEKLLLLKPTTFMNLSGQAVQAAMAFFQMQPQDILVILDDMALPCGKIRLRAGGSSGGHNGLKDIERVLGTTEYPRLRLGIDTPPQYIAATEYVLGGITGRQRDLIDPAIDQACDAVETWMGKGLEAAMNVYNAKRSGDDREADEE
jgi:PTH1 family peptidyl-tRNA hydrolase